MAKHMYSNSMMTAVSLSINCKRDVFTPSVPSGGKPVGIQTQLDLSKNFFIEEERIEKRVVIFLRLLDMALYDLDTHSAIELNISSIHILKELIEGYQNIAMGEVLIKLIFDSKSMASLKKIFARTHPKHNVKIGGVITLIDALLKLVQKDPSTFKTLGKDIWTLLEEYLPIYSDHFHSMAKLAD